MNCCIAHSPIMTQAGTTVTIQTISTRIGLLPKKIRYAPRTPEIAPLAPTLGICEPGEPAALADAWRTWVAEPDGWFAVLHAELLASG